MEYLIHILIMATIYTILAVSLDLLAGQTGLVSIAHAAFFGLGAYTSALLVLRWGCGFLIGVLGGMSLAALVSVIISLPTVRLHDDYFVIATFGFQMILFSIFNNWMALTRGPLGIPGIPQPVVFGWHATSHWEFLLLSSLFALIGVLSVRRLSSSAFGRVLHGIREDEIFVKSLGKNTLRFKASVFAVSAALAASAGSLYAHYITFIDPSSFTVMEAILVISMVIIGGAGSAWGPIVGAVVLIALPEVFRFIDLPSTIAANLRQTLYGSLLVIMILFRPQGIVGGYGFSKSKDSS